MRGKILDFTIQSNSGIISGDDGKRYNFSGASWKSSDTTPQKGLEVDFDINEEGEAVEIYAASEPQNVQEVKVEIPQTATSAILSLIFGIIGLFSSWWLFGVPSIVAIITGHVARSTIKASNGKLTGSGLALAGLILGYIEVVLFLLVVVAGVAFLGAAATYDQY